MDRARMRQGRRLSVALISLALCAPALAAPDGIEARSNLHPIADPGPTPILAQPGEPLTFDPSAPRDHDGEVVRPLNFFDGG